MIDAVADTHAAVWYLAGDPRLSRSAKSAIDGAASLRRNIAISSISLAELVYLVEKGRLPQHAYDDLRAAMGNPQHVFHEAPFTAAVVDTMRQVSRSEIPDMPDRMISATAVHLGVPLISRDGRIRASTVRTIW